MNIGEWNWFEHLEGPLTKRVEPGQPERVIYVVSDGTAETGTKLVRAIATQFRHIPGIVLKRFRGLLEIKDINNFINEASLEKHDILVAYSIRNKEVRDYFQAECDRRDFWTIDLLTPMINIVSQFLDTDPKPVLLPPGERKMSIYRHMEAMEFTLKHDDGLRIESLAEADIILVAPSRAGKTPLSYYLALGGFKVANIPLVRGQSPPPILDSLPPGKVVGLLIDPEILAAKRKTRKDALLIPGSSYDNPKVVLEDLEFAQNYFRHHARWPVINVTNSSIEETAQLILKKLELSKPQHN